jgi:3-oxoacyl-[acyl-carrier-protein] synthase-3
MIEMLERACREAECTPADLDWIVPHQANGRIIEAVRSRMGALGARVVNQIKERGNSSSSTLPHCLASLLAEERPVGKIGLCAFGAGFTYGAAILEAIPGAE